MSHNRISVMLLSIYSIATLTFLYLPEIVQAQGLAPTSWQRYPDGVINMAVVSQISVEPENATCGNPRDDGIQCSFDEFSQCACQCERAFPATLDSQVSHSVIGFNEYGSYWGSNCVPPTPVEEDMPPPDNSNACYIPAGINTDTGPWRLRETHFLRIKPAHGSLVNG